MKKLILRIQCFMKAISNSRKMRILPFIVNTILNRINQNYFIILPILN